MSALDDRRLREGIESADALLADGQLVRAREGYVAAAEGAQQQDRTSLMLRALRGAAAAARSIGDLDAATNHLRAAFAQSEGDAYATAQAAQALGQILGDQGDWAQALRLSETAHAAFVRAADREGEADCLCEIARASLGLGRTGSALQAADGAAQILRSRRQPHKLADAHALAGEALLREGRAAEADERFRRTQEAAQTAGDDARFWSAAQGRAAVALKAGDAGRAEAALREALAHLRAVNPGCDEEAAVRRALQDAAQRAAGEGGSTHAPSPQSESNVLVPVGASVRGRRFDHQGEAIDEENGAFVIVEQAPLEGIDAFAGSGARLLSMAATGLKCVDLLAPLSRGGLNLLLSARRSGELMVTLELTIRLGQPPSSWPVLVSSEGELPGPIDLTEELRDLDLLEYVTAVLCPSGSASSSRRDAIRVGLTMAEFSRRERDQDVLVVLYRLVDALRVGDGFAVEDLHAAFGSVGASASSAAPPGGGGPRGDARLTSLVVASVEDARDAPSQAVRADAILRLSRRIASRGLYPALDPLTSTSRLLTPECVGQEHCRVAAAVRDLLREDERIREPVQIAGRATLSEDDRALMRRVERIIDLEQEAPPREENRELRRQYDLLGERVFRAGQVLLSEDDRRTLRRAEQVRQFLSQNTYVAVRMTNIAASSVPVAETVESFATILRGDLDHIDPEAFFNVGGLSDVEEKWERIRQERAG